MKQGLMSDGFFRVGMIIAALVILFGIRAKLEEKQETSAPTTKPTATETVGIPRDCKNLTHLEIKENDRKKIKLAIQNDCISMKIQWPSAYDLMVDKKDGVPFLRFLYDGKKWVGPIGPPATEKDPIIHWGNNPTIGYMGYDGIITVWLEEKLGNY